MISSCRCWLASPRPAVPRQKWPPSRPPPPHAERGARARRAGRGAGPPTLYQRCCKPSSKCSVAFRSRRQPHLLLSRRVARGTGALCTTRRRTRTATLLLTPRRRRATTSLTQTSRACPRRRADRARQRAFALAACLNAALARRAASACSVGSERAALLAAGRAVSAGALATPTSDAYSLKCPRTCDRRDASQGG